MDILNIIISAGIGFLGGSLSGILITNHNFKKEDKRYKRRQQDDIYQDIIERAALLNSDMENSILGNTNTFLIPAGLKLHELNNIRNSKAHLISDKQKLYLNNYLKLLGYYNDTMLKKDQTDRVLIVGNVKEGSLTNQLNELKKGIPPAVKYFLLWPKSN